VLEAAVGQRCAEGDVLEALVGIELVEPAARRIVGIDGEEELMESSLAQVVPIRASKRHRSAKRLP
jgi:hypothetical protein